VAKKETGGYPVGNPARREKGHPNGWQVDRTDNGNDFVPPEQMPQRGQGPGYSEK